MVAKKKSDEQKKKKKTSQLVIRIDTAERDAFVALCDVLDTSAAREIRRFMRDWVATHAEKTELSDAGPALAEPAIEVVLADAAVAEKAAPKAKRKRADIPA